MTGQIFKIAWEKVATLYMTKYGRNIKSGLFTES